jgi:hypothetical protein
VKTLFARRREDHSRITLGRLEEFIDLEVDDGYESAAGVNFHRLADLITGTGDIKAKVSDRVLS